MTVRAHHPQDLHARRPVGRPGVLDPEGAAPAQRAHELRRRREARHAGQREAVAAAVDLDGDRARRMRFASPDAEGPKIACLVADASDKVAVMIIMVVVLMIVVRMVRAQPLRWKLSVESPAPAAPAP